MKGVGRVGGGESLGGGGKEVFKWTGGEQRIYIRQVSLISATSVHKHMKDTFAFSTASEHK